MLRTEGFQKYLHNVSWLFADKVIRLLSVLLTSVFITRFLGPVHFGQLNYASALVGIFFAFTSMGLDDILTRDLVRNPERRDTLMGTAAAIKLGGSILLLITVLSIALAKHLPSLTVWMVLLIASAELMKPLLVIEPWFHSQVQGRVVAKYSIAQSVVSTIFKLGLVYFKASLIWFAAASAVELMALVVGAYIAYHRNGLHVRTWNFSAKLARQLLTQSWPLLLFGIALYVQAKIDQVMIGDLLRHPGAEASADAEVGQYSAALKMIEAMGFLPTIVVGTLAPAITRARSQSRELYLDRIVNQYRLMFSLFLVTAIPLFFLAEPMMVLLFGEQYRASGWLLSLFAIRLFFTNMGVAKMSFITNEGLFRIALVMSVVGAVCNIALNYVLIPPFKSVGAIWAMIISTFISNFLVDLLFRESRPNFGYTMQGILTFWRFHRAK